MDSTHLRFFTKKSCIALVKSAEMSLISITPAGSKIANKLHKLHMSTLVELAAVQFPRWLMKIVLCFWSVLSVPLFPVEFRKTVQFVIILQKLPLQQQQLVISLSHNFHPCEDLVCRRVTEQFLFRSWSCYFYLLFIRLLGNLIHMRTTVELLLVSHEAV